MRFNKYINETKDKKIKIKTKHGEAIIIKDKDSTRIDSLEIKKQSRKKGYGRNLLIKAIKAAKKETSDGKIYIVADPKSGGFDVNDMVEFYESEGFKIESCESQCPILSMNV